MSARPRWPGQCCAGYAEELRRRTRQAQQGIPIKEDCREGPSRRGTRVKLITIQ